MRLPAQLEGLAGLVIPGGESTTMAKLMLEYGFDKILPAYYASGGAIWGTCAGAIAISSEILGRPAQPRLNLLDISVDRNAYGRQVASFEIEVNVKGLAEPFNTLFIRAPRIARVAPDIEVLAEYAGDPIMVTKDRLMATVFHPELADDDRIHRYFLENVVGP